MTVRELCYAIFHPKSITVNVGEKSSFEVLEPESERVDATYMDLLGEYIVDDVMAISEGEFIINVLCKLFAFTAIILTRAKSPPSIFSLKVRTLEATIRSGPTTSLPRKAAT